MRLKKLMLILLVLIFAGCGVKGNGSGKEEEKKEKLEISDLATEAVADASGTSGSDREPDSEDSDAVIFAFICGEVKEPGVYEVKKGSRKVEVLDAAGGFTDKAARDVVNLAEVVNDGDMIYIPSEEEAASGNFKRTENDGTDGIVNINTADVNALSSLPGIGATRAEAIIKYRKKHGGFEKPEDIMKVSGIGESIYAELKDRITV